MKHYVLVFVCLFFLASATTHAEDPVDLVNPYIGTHGGIGPSLYGGMIPGVARPFGSVQWTPMTRLNKIGGAAYRYGDSSIMGFLGSRQPAVWMGDYGMVSIMPGTGKVQTGFNERKLRFKHDEETTTPCYYKVEMGRITAEVAATMRCSIMRFTFDRDMEPYLVIDASREEGFSGRLEVDVENNRITGFNTDRHSAHLGPLLPNFRGWFVIELDRPVEDYGVYKDEVASRGAPSAEGDRIGAWVKFPPGSRTIQVRIGTSLISLAQAEENLGKEVPHWDLEKVKAEGREEWNEQLSRIEVKGGTRDQRVIFYTGMYHAHLYPRLFSEYGRYYSAFDDKVHRGVAYNDYSLWDTFRAEHPLLILTASERVSDMMTSLINMYEEGGWLPKWPNPTYSGIMIGSHADSVLADAWVKGIRGFDLEKAYEATRKNAMVPPDGDREKRWEDRALWSGVESRGGLSWYKELGYVPVDKTAESVSRTLEFAYDDFCVAQLAKAAGREKDYELLMERSRNYRNLYHEGWFKARKADGSWAGGMMTGYTEATRWQYLFCAMQDVPGMIEMLGGKEVFEARLDKVFLPALRFFRYLHSNEPVHHYIYLYDYCGAPWKAQKQARLAMQKYYHNKPAGLNGNDDCGQMSAWYIFSSLGFYPVTPGADLYAMGSPLWEEAVVKIGKPYHETEFRIIAKNQGPKNFYVQSALLNGEPLDEPFIRHSQIVKGGELTLEMGPEPNMQWGDH